MVTLTECIHHEKIEAPHDGASMVWAVCIKCGAVREYETGSNPLWREMNNVTPVTPKDSYIYTRGQHG